MIGNDDGLMSLFAFVVRSRRLLTGGMRSSIADARSWIVVSAASGSESVDGRPKPGKEVIRTLIVDAAMIV